MQVPRTLALVSGIAFAALSGCAPARTDFPSLLPRPIEDRSDAVVAVEPLPVVADSALDMQISRLGGDLDAADTAFGVAAKRAERFTRSAGAAGTDSWIDAQVALAELDTLRAPVVGILAQLETLAIDRGTGGQPPYPALDTAIDAARKRNDAQAARVRAIEASLGSR